jgi:hypothetical protein
LQLQIQNPKDYTWAAMASYLCSVKMSNPFALDPPDLLKAYKIEHEADATEEEKQAIEEIGKILPAIMERELPKEGEGQQEAEEGPHDEEKGESAYYEEAGDPEETFQYLTDWLEKLTDDQLVAQATVSAISQVPLEPGLDSRFGLSPPHRKYKAPTHVAIIGDPGTGKTTLGKLLSKEATLRNLKVVKVAPTGIAALLTGGHTEQGFFGLTFLNHAWQCRAKSYQDRGKAAGGMDMIIRDEFSQITQGGRVAESTHIRLMKIDHNHWALINCSGAGAGIANEPNAGVITVDLGDFG